MSKLGTIPKTILLLLLFGWIVLIQLIYDVTKTVVATTIPSSLSPTTVRMIDLGFHSAVASFFWIPTMPEILDLFRSRTEYFTDLAFINAVDPKLSYPYAFSVLALPIVPKKVFPNSVQVAAEIGKRGIANADPDWRIPYYMAINYYLALKDLQNATKYFDIAAHVPGVPDYAQRFSLNFGISQRERDRIRNLWATVYQSTNDPDAKARAAAYVERMNDLDYLEAGAKIYKQRFGAYPGTPDDLVKKGIIPTVPQDPFGFIFILNSDGSAGIDLTRLPSYITPTTITVTTSTP